MSTYEIHRTQHPYALTRLVSEEDGSMTLRPSPDTTRSGSRCLPRTGRRCSPCSPRCSRRRRPMAGGDEAPNPFFASIAALEDPRAAGCTHPLAHHARRHESGTPAAVRSPGRPCTDSGGRRGGADAMKPHTHRRLSRASNLPLSPPPSRPMVLDPWSGRGSVGGPACSSARASYWHACRAREGRRCQLARTGVLAPTPRRGQASARRAASRCHPGEYVVDGPRGLPPSRAQSRSKGRCVERSIRASNASRRARRSLFVPAV